MSAPARPAARKSLLLQSRRCSRYYYAIALGRTLYLCYMVTAFLSTISPAFARSAGSPAAATFDDARHSVVIIGHHISVISPKPFPRPTSPAFFGYRIGWRRRTSMNIQASRHCHDRAIRRNMRLFATRRHAIGSSTPPPLRAFSSERGLSSVLLFTAAVGRRASSASADKYHGLASNTTYYIADERAIARRRPLSSCLKNDLHIKPSSSRTARRKRVCL